MRYDVGIGTTLVLALLVGCGGGGSGGGSVSPTSGALGTLTICVTDAPFPSSYVASASVIVREVRVRDRLSDGWTTVFEGERVFDLVPLTGGVTDLLVEVDLPEGVYDEVRLIVDADQVVLSEDAWVRTPDRVFTAENGGMKVPSGDASGIKVKISNDIVVTSGLTADLTLDFDLSRNFVFNGAPDHPPGVKRVLFTPVVRAVNTSTTGTVTFAVASDAGTPDVAGDDTAVEKPTVHVEDGFGDFVTTVTGDLAGTVSVGLDPGMYTLRIEASGHEARTLDGVEVSVANRTDLGVVALRASPAELSGVVYDDQGTEGDDLDDLPLEGATVTLTVASDPGAEPLAATTSPSGAYRFGALLPGTYTLTFAAEGFQPRTVADVIVDLGAVLFEDAALSSSTPP